MDTEQQRDFTHFTTQSGVVLELQPVKMLVLTNFMQQMGLFDVMQQANAEQVLADSQQVRRVIQNQPQANGQLSLNMFNYCMGFGVKTDPPPHDLATLRSIGANLSTPQAARTEWLRMLILADLQEAGELAGQIIYLTLSSQA